MTQPVLGSINHANQFTDFSCEVRKIQFSAISETFLLLNSKPCMCQSKMACHNQVSGRIKLLFFQVPNLFDRILMFQKSFKLLFLTKNKENEQDFNVSFPWAVLRLTNKPL